MEEAEFKIKEPETKVKCSVVDKGYAVLCSVDDVSITITPIRMIISRLPLHPKKKFFVSEGIGAPTTTMEKVWVEWFR